MRISVWDRGLDDSYLKLITQLGADAIGFGTDSCFPGVQEQGYPDFDELLKIKKKIYSWGLEINRVTLPNISEKFMSGQNESEIELENTTKAYVSLRKRVFHWLGNVSQVIPSHS